MLIWKPPAFLIVFGAFAVLGVGGALLLINVLGVLPADERSKDAIVALWGAGTVVADAVFRKRAGLSAFDLSRSTMLFVVPTWAIGLLLVVAGLKGWA